MNWFQESSFEGTRAQERTNEISALPGSRADALPAQAGGGNGKVRNVIDTGAGRFTSGRQGGKMHRPVCDPVKNLLNQCGAVLIRSGMMNTDLSALGINCTSTECLVTAAHRQILAAQEHANAGDAGEARAVLGEFLGTLQSLQDAYRMILIREDLPPATAQDVLSIAQSLDVIAVRVRTG